LQLCEPVGEGNFGVVYRAQLLQKDHYLTVAVKMLKGFNLFCLSLYHSCNVGDLGDFGESYCCHT